MKKQTRNSSVPGVAHHAAGVILGKPEIKASEQRNTAPPINTSAMRDERNKYGAPANQSGTAASWIGKTTEKKDNDEERKPSKTARRAEIRRRRGSHRVLSSKNTAGSGGLFIV